MAVVWALRARSPKVSHGYSAEAVLRQQTIEKGEKQVHLLLSVEVYQQRMMMNDSNVHGAHECQRSD